MSGGPQGEALGTQYLAEDVEFKRAPFQALPEDFENSCGGFLYRDPAHARSGSQVGRSFCGPHGEDFNQYASFFARVTQLSRRVTVYVGEEGGTETVYLYAYNAKGAILGASAVVPGSKGANVKGADTELTLEPATGSPEIAYFSVFEKSADADPLEIDDLIIETSGTSLPPQLQINAVPLLSGYPGGTVDVPVSIERYNGAGEPVSVAVKGLPAGVSVTGGTTIASGSTHTTVTLAVSAQAALGVSAITVEASSPDVGEAVSTHTQLTIGAALAVELDRSDGLGGVQQASAALAPCSSQQFDVSVLQAAPGEPHLQIEASGETAGLTAQLGAEANAETGYPPLEISSSPAGATGSATYRLTATLAPYAPSSATVTVERVAGRITSVSGGGPEPFREPLTPQLGAGGSQITVTGSGLCPGSTVQFGNQLATVAPSSFGPGGESLTATIPAAATSGKVTVHTPAGALTSPHGLRIDSFRNSWGFSFPNYHGPQSSEVNVQLAEELFGTEEVQFSTPFGDVLSLEAALWIAWAEGVDNKGVCFGMSALVQWLSEQTPSYYLDQQLEQLPNNGVLPFKLKEPNASPALRHLITLFHEDQFSGQVLKYESSELNESKSISPQRTVEAVQGALTGSQSEIPVVDIQNQGPKGGGHAMVAYAIEDDESEPGGHYIDVYNPDRPYSSGEESESGTAHQEALQHNRIHVSSDGSWTFPGFQPAWFGDAHHLFALTADEIPDPFSSVPDRRPELSVFGSAFSVVTENPEALLAIGSATTSATIGQVTNGAGQTLIAPDGSENTDVRTRIPGATLDFPASDAESPPTAVVPANGSYSVAEHGSGGGSFHDTFRGAGIDAAVTSTTRAGITSTIGVAPRTGTIDFRAGAGRPPLTVEMVAGPRGRERGVTLATTAVAGGQSSVNFRGGAVRYVSTGGASTVRLGLTSVSSSSLPAAFQSAPVAVPAGDTATFSPSSWGGLSSVTATISGHGARRSIVLRSVLGALHPVRSVKLAVRAGAGRTRVLTIDGRVGSLPAGSRVELLWLLRRGRATIARHLQVVTIRSGAADASLRFTAPSAGRYLFSGRVTVIERAGFGERGASAARSLPLAIG